MYIIALITIQLPSVGIGARVRCASILLLIFLHIDTEVDAP